jgi:hypothetical protein
VESKLVLLSDGKKPRTPGKIPVGPQKVPCDRASK